MTRQFIRLIFIGLAVAAVFIVTAAPYPLLWLLLLIAATWFLMDAMLGEPAEKLALEAKSVASSAGQRAPSLPSQHRLGDLPESILAMSSALDKAHQEIKASNDKTSKLINEQKRWLETILMDLSEGVIVCNLGHKIMLYNQAAARIFEVHPALGLGQPAFRLFSRGPVIHNLETLLAKGGTAPVISFIVPALEGKKTLNARLSVIYDSNQQPSAYVLSFAPIKDEIDALERLDKIRDAVTKDWRRPLASLLNAAELIERNPSLDVSTRKSLEKIIVNQTKVLCTRMEEVTSLYMDGMLWRWPMSDIHSSDFISALAKQLRRENDITLEEEGRPAWMRGDNHAMSQLADLLLRRIAAFAKTKKICAAAIATDGKMILYFTWAGDAPPPEIMNSWLDVPLDVTSILATPRQVLECHDSSVWCEEKTGISRLFVPFPVPCEHEKVAPRLPSRPEFYDFGLLHEHDNEFEDRPLRSLTYVVFDSETTGLNPSGGDEIVALAGVRVVNGRLLTGESFDHLVNPQKTIPPESIRFHGITDDMIKDKPRIEDILPEFKTFSDGAVLVAHNAAFDLKFLKIKEKSSGVEFHNPILDTLLLSAFLDPHLSDHSLDAIASRFRIEIPGRHTALGDAQATAVVLIRLLEALENRGIHTLREIMRASDMAAQIRISQSQW